MTLCEIDMYLLYKKADICKSNSQENRFPIPYYLIDAFAKYECENRTPTLISSNLCSSSKIDKVTQLYTAVTKAYTKSIKQTTDLEYNQMIKKPLDYQILENHRDVMSEVL